MPEGTSLDVVEFLQRDKKYPRLPDQVKLQFGPPSIGEYILHSDLHVREQGIRLSLSTDFHELKQLNVNNLADWYELPSWYDPTYGEIPEGQGFWIRGIDATGNTVACHCGRLYPTGRSTFRDEVESLRMLISDDTRRADARTRAQVPAAIAAKMSGRIVAAGGFWVHRNFRGIGLSYLLPQLTRAIALTTWYPDYHTTLVEAKKADKMRKVYGYPEKNWERGMLVDGLPGVNHQLDFVICWATPDDTIAYVEDVNAHHVRQPAKAIATVASH